MPLNSLQTAAIGRLGGYYDGDSAYNPQTNPGGMRQGGHVINFIPALRDVVTASQGMAAIAADAQASADAAAQSAYILATYSSTNPKAVATNAVQTFTPLEKFTGRQNIDAASWQDQITQGILLAKLKGSVANMFDYIADDFAGPDGVDLPASFGAFVDTVNGVLVGGVGGPTLVIENTPSLPKMISNTQTATGDAGYVVSATTENFGGTGAAWNLWDGSSNGWFGSVAFPQINQIKTPKSILLAGYAITGYDGTQSFNITAWRIEGSNVGSANQSDWTVLDTQTGISLGSGVRNVFSIPKANQGSYLYHRLVVTASGGNSSIYVPELELLQYTPAFESHPSLPPMTSNTAVANNAAGYTAFASSQDSSYPALQPYKVFDQDTLTSNNSASLWRASSTAFPQFVGLATPNPIKIGGYAVVGFWDGTNNFYPTAWQVQGTNDTTAATNPSAANWTTLDTRAGMVFTGGERKTLSIPTINQGAYSYHRLLVTAHVSNGSPLQMGTFDPLQVLTGIEGQPSIPSMTGSSAPAGYAVTASSFYGAGMEGWRARDGVRPSSNGTVNQWTSANASLPHTLTQQVPSPITVQAYRLSNMGPTYGPLSWQLRGSNTNNGSDWTVVDSRTVGSNFWGGKFSDWLYFKVQSPGAYSYYQLVINNSGNGYAQVGEIEFLQGTSGNMDLRSKAFPAQAVPMRGSLFALVSLNAGTLTMNGNLIAQMSRNGGANWKNFPLAKIGDLGGFGIYEVVGVDLTDQPSGQSMKYRFQTNDNQLGINLGAVVAQWG